MRLVSTFQPRTGRLLLALSLLAITSYLFFAHGGLRIASSNLAVLVPGQARGPSDFYQLWASALSVYAGEGAYPSLPDTLDKFVPFLGSVKDFARDSVLPLNAYPPPATVAVLPLGMLTYSRALDVWLITNVVCMVAVMWWAAGLIARHPGWRASLTLWLFVLWLGSSAARHDLGAANVGGVLAFLTSASWIWADRGRHHMSAVAVSLAAGLKAFPAVLAVWLVDCLC